MRTARRIHPLALPAVAAITVPIVAAIAADAAPGPEKAFLWGTAAADVVLLGAYLIASDTRILRDLVRAFRLEDVPRGLLLGLFALGAAILAVNLGRSVGVTETDQVAISDASASFLVALTASRVLVGPVLEELFYRGLLQSRLQGWIGPWAVPVQACAFAFAHMRSFSSPDGLAILSSASVGVVLGWGVHRWKRLGPAILAHALVNIA